MDNQYPNNASGLQKVGIDAVRDNDENLARTVFRLIETRRPEEMPALLNFLETNNIGNPQQTFAVNAEGQVQNAGEVPRSSTHDYDAYIMAGIGILVIGAIFWIHRETFFEFFATIGRTTAESISHSIGVRVRTASPEDLRLILDYFAGHPAA